MGPRGPGASRYVHSVVRRKRRRRRRKGRHFLDEIFSAMMMEVTREVRGWKGKVGEGRGG